MKQTHHLSVLIILLAALAGWQSVAAIPAKPVIELLEQIAKLTGKNASKATSEALERAFLAHGKAALEITRRNGIGLAEAAARHGDEVMALAVRVPESAPLLIHRSSELLPLAQRYGDNFLRLEARIPGLAGDAFKAYPHSQDIGRIMKLPPEQARAVVSYASHAQDPHAASALLKAVEKNGRSVLERLDPKQILAYGLSTAMVAAATGTSLTAGDTVARVVGDQLRPTSWVIAMFFAVFASMLLFRFWRWRRSSFRAKPRLKRPYR